MGGRSLGRAERCETLTVKKNEAILCRRLQKHEEIISPITKPWFLGSRPSFHMEEYSVSSKTVHCL